MTTWPLTTERLVLRPFETDDFEAIWAYRGLADVNQWLGGSLDPDETRQRFAEPGDGLTQLTILHEGEVVGDLMLRVQDAWAQRDVVDQAKASVGVLGWTLRPDAGGRGLATEAVRELLRHAFDDLGLRRVIAECFAANEPSWRLMERVGMRREAHHVRDSLHRALGWQDEYVYALLAEEWRDRQAAPNVDASITKR
jgi:RimJ/RimL family protein N-acetyltransferase